MMLAGIPVLDRDVVELTRRLRTLEDCPDELPELRGTLLREHAWRMEHGIRPDGS
jgi:hypothetical protein